MDRDRQDNEGRKVDLATTVADPLQRLVIRAISYFRIYHSHIKDPINELEISTVPGYWRVKAGCPGGSQCVHAFRIMGGWCNGKTELTVSFSEHGVRDDKGRWVKPYRAWEAWKVLYG